ncbi:MAG: immunoglobulin domain-containing protein [Opitutae bacterium]|nr:immunoglobulin domain-containing protein [Opitutae bacterium]
MQSNLRLRFFVLLGLLAFAASASAYVLITDNGRTVKWTPGTVFFDVKVGTSRTLQDGTNFSTSFLEAEKSWNAVIGSVQLSGNIEAEGAPTQKGDGYNQSFFAADVYGEAFGTDTIAITTSYRSTAVQGDGTYRRLESDIVFNNARTWDSYRGNRQGTTIDFRRVAIHELGHVLGLDHPDEASPVQTVSAVMNSHVSNIDTQQSDDVAGAQSLYGTSTSVNRPANDNFANALALTLTNNAVTVTGANNYATKETGEPNHAPNEAGGSSVWWKWNATASGSLTVTTAGSNFDTLLGAYTGTSVSALTQLASNDDVQSGVIRTSTITFNVVGGTTYYFAADGWNGEWGNVSLNLTFSPSNTAVAPTITSQPQAVTVTAGGNASFSVTATGNPAPTYQWLKGSTAISGATSATLNLTNVQSGDAGSYTVTVTNSAGSVTSNAATLTVNPAATAPTITAQPQSATVTTGGSASFSVTATGTPAPTYQWLKNSTAINGATSATYTISSATTADAGSYTVTVTNSAGSVTSSAATLTVNTLAPAPSSGGGGGGGGAPSAWFGVIIALLLVTNAVRTVGLQASNKP